MLVANKLYIVLIIGLFSISGCGTTRSVGNINGKDTGIILTHWYWRMKADYKPVYIVHEIDGKDISRMFEFLTYPERHVVGAGTHKIDFTCGGLKTNSPLYFEVKSGQAYYLYAERRSILVKRKPISKVCVTGTNDCHILYKDIYSKSCYAEVRTIPIGKIDLLLSKPYDAQGQRL